MIQINLFDAGRDSYRSTSDEDRALIHFFAYTSGKDSRPVTQSELMHLNEVIRKARGRERRRRERKQHAR